MNYEQYYFSYRYLERVLRVLRVPHVFGSLPPRLPLEMGCMSLLTGEAVAKCTPWWRRTAHFPVVSMV